VTLIVRILAVLIACVWVYLFRALLYIILLWSCFLTCQEVLCLCFYFCTCWCSLHI